MSMEIEFEKIVNDAGVLGVVIRRIEALHWEELPELYLENPKAVLKNNYGHLQTAQGAFEVLRQGGWYALEDFDVRIERLRRAGRLLGKVNAELSAKRKNWSGAGRIVI